MLDDARRLLREHWGHDDFREAQAAALEKIIEGEDVFAVLPTGYGKSVIFQIPPLLDAGCALVFSPLISLMKDQVDDCRRRGIAASYINSHVDDSDMEDRLENFTHGRYRVFYVSPERIRSGSFQTALNDAPVTHVVCDEAHAASRWGHDFRPAYANIHTVINKIERNRERPVVIGVTATATFDVEKDAAAAIGLRADYARVVADPIRPNLRYAVEGGSWNALKRWASGMQVDTGRYIFYSATQKGAEKIKEIITERDLDEHKVGVYHGGMVKEAREEAQNAFKAGRTPVMCATCAFGMGIDVPNIRGVFHFGIPGALEDYIQESGRAGRDGKPADVVLLSTEYAEDLRWRFLNNANPPYSVYEALWAWLHERLDEQEVLSLSAAGIAVHMRRYVKEHKLPVPENCGSDMAGTALNTMESYGLIARKYLSPEKSLTLYPEEMYDLHYDSSDLKPSEKAVLTYLHDSFITDEMRKEKPAHSLDCEVSEKDIARSTSIAESTVKKALKALQECAVLKRHKRFAGKTTRLVMYGAELEDVLPRDRIEEKRNREQRRLRTMIRYTTLPMDRRLELVRNYFLKAPKDA